MDRRHKDMVRLSEILGDRYEKKKDRSAFLVLTDEDGITSMACGSWREMFNGVMDALTETLARTAKPGIDVDAFVETATRTMTRAFRKALERNLWLRHGKPDLSIETQDPEEKLRRALLGED